MVVDASAVVHYLLRSQPAEDLDSYFESRDRDLHTVALCDLEVASALRRAVHLNRIAIRDASEVVVDYLDLPLERHGHVALLGRVLELRENLTAYDAAYVALAERLRAPLLTADRRLARAAMPLVEMLVPTALE